VLQERGKTGGQTEPSRADSWTLLGWISADEEVALPRPPDEVERFGSVFPFLLTGKIM